MSASGIGDFQNRTLICSVLFIDIVEYSQKSVVEQNNVKNRFNALLSEALRGVAVNDRIILDTGDGAAISFIGDPEDALFVATGLRDVSNEADSAGPLLSTRMGINLGPVRLVKDINGQPNIIGDGINVAQRVMTFAQPGQVLVSRSYYEVVSRLSDESSRLFSYEGSRTDKHIREHEVYAVGAIPALRRRVDEQQAADWRATEEATPAPALTRAAQTIKAVAARFVRRPRLATAVAVGGILAIALGARAYRAADEPVEAPSREVVAATPPAPALEPPAPAKREEPLPPIKGLPPEPVAQEAVPKEEPKQSRATEMKSRERAPAVDAKPRGELASAPSQAPSGDPATVSFAISPWGEVHVDGKMHGVSPPLQELSLPPGRHRIELRNSGLPSHVVTVNAKPGERLRIKHKFN